MIDADASIDQRVEQPSRRRPLLLMAASFGLTLVLLVVLLIESVAATRNVQSLRSEYLPAERLAGEIVYLDEVLTMSARMATVTGDLRWERRYESNIESLEVATAETRRLGESGLFPLEGLDQIDGANAVLAGLESEALKLVVDQRTQAAGDILNGETYRRNKLRYAAGVEVLTQDMQAAIDERLADAARRNSRSRLVTLIALVGSLVLWLLIWHSLGSWRRRTEHDDRLRQAVEEENQVRLAETEMLFDQLVQNAPIVLYQLDHGGEFTNVAGRGLNHFGVTPDQLVGRPIHRAMRGHDQLLEAVDATLRGEPTAAQVTTPSATFSAVHMPIEVDDEITGLIGIATDVTQEINLQRELRHQARHDGLTGLINRDEFRFRLEQAIADTGAPVAVFLFDIDGFTEINDTRGHLAGDRVLVELAARFEALVPDGGTLARLGGDEFALLVGFDDAQPIRALADGLHRACREPISDQTGMVELTACIGLFGPVTDRKGLSADGVMADADLALQEARARGTGRTIRFTEQLRTDLLERVVLRKEIDRAIAGDEFRVVFQPVWNLVSGRIHGVEALVRWEHPERGLIGPGAFVPLAEQTGQVTNIDLIVFDNACRQLAAWRRTGESWATDLVLSVNISAVDFDNVDLVSEVSTVVERHGLDPNKLVIELTETAVMGNTASAKATLAELGKLGVRVALDDFGTGYSSLSQLEALEINVLKIDRSFVSGPELTSMTLAETIVGLGRSLRLDLVAEGIETADQLAQLQRFGCHFAQGFLLARPMSAADVAATARATMRSGHSLIGNPASDPFRSSRPTVSESTLPSNR